MNLIVVGTNHKYSPFELRERLSFSKKSIKDALFLLKERGALKGAIILSTCNRVEVYASAEDAESGIRAIVDFILRFQEIDKHRILPYLYTYKGEEAAKHLFLVASGLDSLILGETQISGQVKEALLEAENIGFTNELLRGIFNQALSFAGMIHKETKISEGKISIGSVAIDFIKEKAGGLANKKVLVIGVGKVTELILKYLKKEGPNVIFISNRSYEKAKELAGRIGANIVRFDNLKHHLCGADIVISATSSPHFIIKKDTLEGINNKLFIIDLALPRDVEPSLKGFRNIRLYSLGDLDGVIKKNVERRIKEAEKVRRTVNVEIEKLWEGITKPEPEPALLP